jgi:hypothetical protein
MHPCDHCENPDCQGCDNVAPLYDGPNLEDEDYEDYEILEDFIEDTIDDGDDDDHSLDNWEADMDEG